MPLPPAPSKRADRLPAKAFDASARSSGRPRRKTEVSAPATTNGVVLPLVKPVVAKTALKESPRITPPSAPVEPSRVSAPVPTAKSTASSPRPSKRIQSGPAKLFVLDTNVLLHDPMCLFRF